MPSAGWEGKSGLRLEREQASLTRVDGEKVHLTERRFSLAIHVLPFESGPLGHFAIASLKDFRTSWRENSTIQNEEFARFGLLPCHLLTGIACFQCLICEIILEWSSDWNATLLKLEESFAVKVCENPRFPESAYWP